MFQKAQITEQGTSRDATDDSDCGFSAATAQGFEQLILLEDGV